MVEGRWSKVSGQGAGLAARPLPPCLVPLVSLAPLVFSSFALEARSLFSILRQSIKIVEWRAKEPPLRMTPLPPQENTTPPPPARKRSGRKWLALSGALLVGHVVGFLALIPCGIPLFGPTTSTVVLDLLLLPLSAVIVTALGPLFLVVGGLVVFRVQGGTKTAIGAFVLGVALLYAALIWGLRRWWKTESPRARLLGWLALAGYTALATFCIIYLSFQF